MYRETGIGFGESVQLMLPWKNALFEHVGRFR